MHLEQISAWTNLDELIGCQGHIFLLCLWRIHRGFSSLFFYLLSRNTRQGWDGEFFSSIHGLISVPNFKPVENMLTGSAVSHQWNQRPYFCPDATTSASRCLTVGNCWCCGGKQVLTLCWEQTCQNLWVCFWGNSLLPTRWLCQQEQTEANRETRWMFKY